jgi:hypothetical protein
MQSSEGIGRAGEFLAASILEARGSRASHVAIYGTDLWVETPSGRMLRVQVKTSSKPVPPRPPNGEVYRFLNSRTTNTHSPPDLYLLVALDRQLLLVREKMTVGGIRVPVARFTPEDQEAGIEKYLY